MEYLTPSHLLHLYNSSSFKLHLGDPDLWEVHPQQTVLASRAPLTYCAGITCSFVSYCTKRYLVPTYQGSVSELFFSDLQCPAHKCVCECLSDSLSCQMGPSGPPRVTCQRVGQISHSADFIGITKKAKDHKKSHKSPNPPNSQGGVPGPGSHWARSVWLHCSPGDQGLPPQWPSHFIGKSSKAEQPCKWGNKQNTWCRAVWIGNAGCSQEFVWECWLPST